MHTVRRTYGDSLNLGVIQNLMIIIDGRSATVLLYGLISALGNDVAEILNLALRVGHISGNVCACGNSTATDYGYLNFIFHCFSFL